MVMVQQLACAKVQPEPAQVWTDAAAVVARQEKLGSGKVCEV